MMIGGVLTGEKNVRKRKLTRRHHI